MRLALLAALLLTAVAVTPAQACWSEWNGHVWVWRCAGQDHRRWEAPPRRPDWHQDHRRHYRPYDYRSDEWGR